MKYNTEDTNLTTLDGETLKYVKSFTYLVSIFDEQGGSESDVNARTGKARSDVIQLKNMWNSKQVSASTKVLMIHRDVKTVLLCGAGTRRSTTSMIERVPVFINSCQHMILNIRWSDTISNSLLWKRTNHLPGEEEIRDGWDIHYGNH
ncbi:unnamed protein product [Schistosoma curassoni]|uniref:Rad60-SLD_2 domain-containing protein n=1 Tax=Schistosoma curassoni TaxID=6186 RepID=A0A183KUQ4_9TREM|nr:unnamed protein product [Schistosoma curassoni]